MALYYQKKKKYEMIIYWEKEMEILEWATQQRWARENDWLSGNIDRDRCKEKEEREIVGIRAQFRVKIETTTEKSWNNIEYDGRRGTKGKVKKYDWSEVEWCGVERRMVSLNLANIFGVKQRGWNVYEHSF